MNEYLTLTLHRDTLAHVSEDFTRQVAAVVRAEMGAADLTQERLALQAGMSQSTLSRCLDGKRPFDTDELARLAPALDTTVLEIVTAAERRMARNGAPSAAAP
jgi:transcriptional regulator with XRE-family HTH domain